MHEQVSLLLLVDIKGILSEIFSSKFETDFQKKEKMFSLPNSNMILLKSFVSSNRCGVFDGKRSHYKRKSRLRENLIWLASAL